MATLSIENASKEFGDTQVLKDISLEVNEGEFLVLLGSSGCGKSTLLNVIAGLEQVSTGTIRMDGTIINEVHPKNRDMAMVFQNYALYPNMSVEKNIGFGLEMRGVSRADRKAAVQEVAKLLQMEHLLARKPSELSGGQRQRVAMGRALVRRPKIFLFDEPLSNLDAKLRGELRTEIKKLHKSVKATMIYVTHDQIEAMTLADRIAILKDGRIQQVGTPTQIYNAPANMYVGGFVGAPPMSFLSVRVAERGEELGVVLPVLCKGEGVNHFLPLPRPARLHGRMGQQVVLGIRPEMITHASWAGPAHPVITCDVDLLEPTGADTLCVIQLAGKAAKARITPMLAPEPGDVIELAVDTTRIGLFDPETRDLIV